MFKSILILAMGLGISSAAGAQEYGVLLGVHQTTADTEAANTSVDGQFGFKAGFAAAFGLVDNLKFRTGVIYNQRHYELKMNGIKAAEVNFDYFDIPALVQYNMNEMFGIFGGLIAAVNVNDQVKGVNGATFPSADADKLIPLLNVGANLTFDDMIGFDLYYERGLGSFAYQAKDFSTFGANFIYWF